jgi:hypothetical protein
MEYNPTIINVNPGHERLWVACGVFPLYVENSLRSMTRRI